MKEDPAWNRWAEGIAKRTAGRLVKQVMDAMVAGTGKAIGKLREEIASQQRRQGKRIRDLEKRLAALEESADGSGK